MSNALLHDFTTISYAVVGQLATITMQRPERRNALNQTMVSELTMAFVQAAMNDVVRVVRLRGDGEAFSAGADLDYLRQLQANTYHENAEDTWKLANLFQIIDTNPKITIAELHGHAIAGGCGLATVTDFTFSVPEAQLGYTEVKIGFIPAIVSVYLKKKVPEGVAKRLLLTGDLFTAHQAMAMGLVTEVVDRTLIESHVEAFAERLARTTSRNSIAVTKILWNRLDGQDIETALSFATQANAETRASADCKRGIAAFLAKEKITW